MHQSRWPFLALLLMLSLELFFFICFLLHLFFSEWPNNVRRILHIFVVISLKSSVATTALEKQWRGTGCC